MCSNSGYSSEAALTGSDHAHHHYAEWVHVQTSEQITGIEKQSQRLLKAPSVDKLTSYVH